MDTFQSPKKEKKKSEPTSGRSSHANTGHKGVESFEANGRTYPLPPDFHDLEEIDYSDASVKTWLRNQEADSIRLYGKPTVAEVEYMESRRPELQIQYPERSVVELNQLALAEVRGTPLQPPPHLFDEWR